MPVVVSYPADRIVKFSLSGHYTFSEVVDALRLAIHDVDPSHFLLGILDIQKSEETRSIEELRLLAREISEGAAFREFVVIAAHEIRYALARQLSIFAEDEGMEVDVRRVAPA